MKQIIVARREKIHLWEREKLHIGVFHIKPNKKRKRRSSTEENANNNNNECELPADVVSSIFIRCPVNTLSMLRCASKSWNDFITSPPFVHSHLEQSTENAQLLFLKPNYSEVQQLNRCRLQFVSVDMEGKGETNEVYAVTLPRFPYPQSGFHVSAGLVCISLPDCIYLCNPLMQQLCKLPKCSPCVVSGWTNVGFGFLHSTKEFKVVHFFYTSLGNHPFPFCTHLQVRCEVFTFSLINGVGGISNIWKEIVKTPPCYPSGPGLLVNECYYWWARQFASGAHDRILSFEFESDKFLTISCPSSFKDLPKLSMMDLKGMLCLPDVAHYRESSILDLWILKDKVSCIWAKEYSINLVNFRPSWRTYPIFRTWNEEIIFIHLDKAVFYDLKRKCFRAVNIGFGICQDNSVLFALGFGIYRKSLFSLGST